MGRIEQFRSLRNMDSALCEHLLDDRATSAAKAEPISSTPTSTKTTDADSRKREMQLWVQDWQLAGQLLYGVNASPPEEADDFASLDEKDHFPHQAVGEYDREPSANLIAEASYRNDCFQDAVARRPGMNRNSTTVHRQQSLRIRLKRGVSDSYVFALKTVAAVKRMPRDRE